MPMVLHIGPITLPGGQPGDSLYFLYPPDPDIPPVRAADLAHAVAFLGKSDTLSCEPSLAPQALALNLPVQRLQPAACHALAMMALDLATSDFDSVAREGLVFQFCRAFAAFLTRNPDNWPPATRILQVSGPLVTPQSALIIGGPGLVLARTPALAPTEGLAVIATPAAPEVYDALSRAHGLTLVPGAFRLRDGEKFRVMDPDLALLTATLYAVAAIDPFSGATASGEVSVAGCAISVSVRVQ